MGFYTIKVSGGLVAASLSLLLAGCGETEEAPAQVPSAETVKSRPGIVQVGDDDGPVLGEAETCERFRAGVERNRDRLSCEGNELAECPELIRPLASLACTAYSEASLEICLEAFDEASECEALLPGNCVLTADLLRVDPVCVPDASTLDAGADSGGVLADGGALALDGSVESDGGAPDGGHAEDTAEAGMSDAGETSTADATNTHLTSAPTDEASSTDDATSTVDAGTLGAKDAGGGTSPP